MKIIQLIIIGIFLMLSLFFECLRDLCMNPEDNFGPSENLMVVYPNRGNHLTLVDCNTFEIVKEITVDIPDSIDILRMGLSTFKDYFIFSASSLTDQKNNYFLIYSVKDDSIFTKFSTNLRAVMVPRITAANRIDQPGLFYLYSHNSGMYSIDFTNKKVDLISTEQGNGKDFYVSPNKEWIVLNSYIPATSYTDLKFYKSLNGLFQPEYILNENDQDSIDVMDAEFTNDNNTLYITYLLSNRKQIWEKAFFGSYDLVNKKFNSSHVVLPWSENPYYMAYSDKRKEAYMVGAYDKLYVIDTSTPEYHIKTVIDLTGKNYGVSRILLRPDENVVFVSCINSDLLFIIDLEKKQIIKKLSLDNPNQMLML